MFQTKIWKKNLEDVFDVVAMEISYIHTINYENSTKKIYFNYNFWKIIKTYIYIMYVKTQNLHT